MQNTQKINPKPKLER